MMSFSTISAEPLTLQQFVFFQDELEDGLALHIHLQEREITSERRKENKIFIALNSFCRQIWETDATSVTGTGMETKYVCRVSMSRPLGRNSAGFY